MEGSGHSMASLAERDHLQAPDGQPMWWGSSGVTSGPEQGPSRSFARGGKPSLSVLIYIPLRVSLVCNFKR